MLVDQPPVNPIAAVLQTRVRVLQLNDLSKIMPLELAAYEFPWTESIFRDCFKSGYTGLALETETGQLAGYGVLSAAAGEAHILNVVIDSQWRGHGLGKKLVKRLIDQARWHRAERVFLEVRESNVAARKLYFSLGFNEIGARSGYYPARKGREDAVVMAIELVSES
jgi:[ribosomal protein S18]-alanine N-acetyltransferase